MPAIKNLIGQKFGLLTVLKFEEIFSGHAQWLCQCDCGNLTVAQSNNLRARTTRSCGCLRVASKKLRSYESLYNNLLYGAQSRTVECLLTYEEFLGFTSQLHCHYCNAEISWSEFAISKNGQGHNLDRKDNHLGYSKHNCVVCCARCNRGKSSLFTYAEWYSMTDCLRNEWKLT
jgi:hypothetical protein